MRGDQDEVVVYRLVEARLDLRQRSSAFVSIRQHLSAFVERAVVVYRLVEARLALLLRCQYWYFCARKATVN